MGRKIPARNPRRIPPRIPPQTDPNQAEPHKDSEPPLARRPYAARVADGARTVTYRQTARRNRFIIILIKGSGRASLPVGKIPRAHSHQNPPKPTRTRPNHAKTRTAPAVLIPERFGIPVRHLSRSCSRPPA